MRTSRTLNAPVGFTLLEMMVTMVIVSMIVALLMQSLARSLSLREAVVRHEAEARALLLSEQWFRGSIGSAIADLADAKGGFSGTESTLELLSANSLGKDSLERVRWRIVDRSEGQGLEYSDDGVEFVAVVATGTANGRFQYMGEDGAWRSTWPVEDAPSSVLPRLVRFTAESASGELEWLVAIGADAKVPPAMRPEDLIRGL